MFGNPEMTREVAMEGHHVTDEALRLELGRHQMKFRKVRGRSDLVEIQIAGCTDWHRIERHTGAIVNFLDIASEYPAE